MTEQDSRSDPALAAALVQLCRTSIGLAQAGARSALHTFDATVDGALSTVRGARDGAFDTLRRAGGGTGAAVADYLSLRTQRMLNAFDIPTSRDIHELNARVAALTAQVEKLNAGKKRRR